MRKSLPAVGAIALLSPFAMLSGPAAAAPAGAMALSVGTMSAAPATTAVTYRKWRRYDSYYGYSGYYAPRTYWQPPVVRYYAAPVYQVAPPPFVVYQAPVVVGPAYGYGGGSYYYDDWYGPRRGWGWSRW